MVAAQSGGVANSGDTYGGENWGSYVTTSSINPSNWTRSYSRSGYLDPLPPRSNYDVLANAHVTRILFNSSSPQNNITATGVEYTRDGGATKLTVQVNKEVILASGSVGSPTVLLYSGIGPKDVLDAAGVPVISELPGVGQHLQDHLVKKFRIPHLHDANECRALGCNSRRTKRLQGHCMPAKGLNR